MGSTALNTYQPYIGLFERDTERERGGGEGERERNRECLETCQDT